MGRVVFGNGMPSNTSSGEQGIAKRLTVTSNKGTENTQPLKQDKVGMYIGIQCVEVKCHERKTEE